MHPSIYCNSRSGRPALRVGVLLNDNVQPAWVAEVLEHISKSNFARLELVVYNAEREAKQSLPRKAADALRDERQRRGLLFRLYARWDRRKIAGTDHPFRETDCSPYLKDAEWMWVAPVTRGLVHRFPSDALDRIRGKELDVLIRFGFNILRGEILQAARYGVWSYHHGDNEFYRGGPPCFWEVAEGNPITGAMLQVLTDDLDAGRVLHKGFFATRPGGSWWRNRLQPYWGASTFVIQKLCELHEQGWEQVERDILPAAPYQGKRRMYTTPTNREMVRWLGPQMARRAAEAVTAWPRRLWIEHWMLALHTGKRTRLTTGCAEDLSQFRWVQSPRGHFYADPFLFSHLGKRWVFFEDFDYRTRRGTIAAAETIADGGVSKAVRVLERPYHLSYPCIFRVGEEVYMIPETRAHGTVEMYRCKSFPDSWELAREFLKVSAVDTTVWSEGGMHWFFVTLRERRSGGLQLWLYYSAGIMEDWQPHPSNPISTDIRRSRGGGAIYREGARLMRPSQDCSGNYGRSFTFNEILVLNEHAYAERPCVTVEAPRGMIGTHTYGQLDELEIIDGCAVMPIFKVMDTRSFVSRIRRRLRLT
jgi:hypothetical protein